MIIYNFIVIIIEIATRADVAFDVFVFLYEVLLILNPFPHNIVIV